jgi:tRNA dimethylallyltransferase
MVKKHLVVILGPTAVGKTKTAIDVAKEFDTEIISADSRQFFREMEIGTAKPDKSDLQSVKHHFINSLSVHDEFNVGMFEQQALKTLDLIFAQKHKAILVGGSGLYINAICHGFDQLPAADPEIRSDLNKIYTQQGIGYLQQMLKKLDPEHYGKTDINNPHRMLRALEVCLLTGKTYSELRIGQKQKRNFNSVKIGLTMEREKLYAKINTRVDEMIKSGLLNEVRSMIKYKNLNALQTVGYKELFEHLDGKSTLEETVDRIKQNTRNFAKRQMTWFRRDKEIKWFDSVNAASILQYIREVAV